MLYHAIRYVLWLSIWFLVILKIKKSKMGKKKFLIFVSFIIGMVLVALSDMFPVENLWISFKSPESVFLYTKTGEIDEIIYGQESCMIFYTKKNGIGGYYIIPKAEKGFKIPNCLTEKEVARRFDEEADLNVYNVKGTNDYYIWGRVHLKEANNEIAVFNGMDKKVESNIVFFSNPGYICIYSQEFSDEQYLLINDKKVLFVK